MGGGVSKNVQICVTLLIDNFVQNFQNLWLAFKWSKMNKYEINLLFRVELSKYWSNFYTYTVMICSMYELYGVNAAKKINKAKFLIFLHTFSSINFGMVFYYLSF